MNKNNGKKIKKPEVEISKMIRLPEYDKDHNNRI